jgi:hypothetical protein
MLMYLTLSVRLVVIPEVSYRESSDVSVDGSSVVLS